jgi:hypothetical protein
MTRPTVPGLHKFIDAIVGQSRKEAGDVTLVFSDGVNLPEASDLVVEFGGYFPCMEFGDT